MSLSCQSSHVTLIEKTHDTAKNVKEYLKIFLRQQQMKRRSSCNVNNTCMMINIICDVGITGLPLITYISIIMSRWHTLTKLHLLIKSPRILSFILFRDRHLHDNISQETMIPFTFVFVSLVIDLLGFTLILPLMPSILDYYSSHDEVRVIHNNSNFTFLYIYFYVLFSFALSYLISCDVRCFRFHSCYPLSDVLFFELSIFVLLIDHSKLETFLLSFCQKNCSI